MKNRETTKVFCGLGSNVGDKKDFIFKAKEFLNDDKNKTLRLSSVYETLPMGEESQSNYFNAVIEIETQYSLKEFYDFIKDAEKKIGRKKTYRWGPREIDIDILLFGEMIYSDEKITVPHSGMKERDFVLVPLLEIAGDIEIPGENKKLSELINKLQNHYILRKV